MRIGLVVTCLLLGASGCVSLDHKPVLRIDTTGGSSATGSGTGDFPLMRYNHTFPVAEARHVLVRDLRGALGVHAFGEAAFFRFSSTGGAVVVAHGNLSIDFYYRPHDPTFRHQIPIDIIHGPTNVTLDSVASVWHP